MVQPSYLKGNSDPTRVCLVRGRDERWLSDRTPTFRKHGMGKPATSGVLPSVLTIDQVGGH